MAPLLRRPLSAAGADGRWEGSSSSSSSSKVEVARVQVAVLGTARQRVKATLERLADSADTSSKEGLHALLQGGWVGAGAGARI